MTNVVLFILLINTTTIPKTHRKFPVFILNISKCGSDKR